MFVSQKEDNYLLVMQDIAAVELIPESYCEHIVGATRVWAATITPQAAARLLSFNTHNRKAMESHSDAIAKIISDGDWWFNGGAIRIGSDGTLLDGQHRLMACIEANREFSSLVVGDLDPACFPSIDSASRPRHASHVLGMRGEKYANMISSAVKQFNTFCLTGAVHAGGGMLKAVCPEKVIRILDKNEGLRQSVVLASQLPVYRLGALAMLHYVFSIVDGDKADEFMHVMQHGDSNKRRPFDVLRESVIRTAASRKRIEAREIAAKAIKAFNAELEQRPFPAARWRDSEDFPTINGLDYSKLPSMVE